MAESLTDVSAGAEGSPLAGLVDGGIFVAFAIVWQLPSKLIDDLELYLWRDGWKGEGILTELGPSVGRDDTAFPKHLAPFDHERALALFRMHRGLQK